MSGEIKILQESGSCMSLRTRDNVLEAFAPSSTWRCSRRCWNRVRGQCFSVFRLFCFLGVPPAGHIANCTLVEAAA